MANLTDEQQAELDSLTDMLGNLPVGEAIMRCQDAMGLDPRIGADRARMDTAMAAAWAYDRMLTYLDCLRGLNEERMEAGRAIHELKNHPYPTTDAEVEAAALAYTMAPHLAGRQEVIANFFCVSVQHIRSFLKVLSAAVGYEIPQNDLDYLDKFRHLRNHYEHWYERLPGGTNEAGLITKTLAEDSYHVVGGLDVDDQDRYVVIELKKTGAVTHVVPVTNAGLARVEAIVQETAPKVKSLAIDRVREHFAANPETIPSPRCLPPGLLIGVGGYEL